ncbi:MAG TPA: adenylate/guanylate cyclase domain-containing protein [Polyangiaceae bacterium]|jgi:adenylate cyclase
MARLILSTAEGQQGIELRPINSLGRHPNNSIQLLDKIVSKEHCIVEQRDGLFILRDLGSLNGTYINGERVRGEQLLRHGDEITLGSTRARYDDGTQPLPPAPPLPMGVAAGLPPPAIVQGGAAPPMQQPMQQPMQMPSWPQPGAPPASMMQPQMGMQMQRPMQQQPVAQMPMGVPQQPYGAPLMQQARAPMNPMSGQPGPATPQMGQYGRPARPPSFSGTRVDMLDSARAIGTQIAAQTKGFLPFEQIAADPQQLRLDYERLRITWELTRDIGLERDFDKLLEKILQALFRFVKADRGVILLKDETGELQPRAARRRDGTDAPIQVSSTILNHIIKEKASVLTHDASMDFAASKGKSMILNRISSAIVVPLLHEGDVLGALWLDSESLAQFQQKDLEIITAVGNQAAMFIENNLLQRKVEQEIVTRERFSRLLSPNVAEQVISGKLEVKLGGQLLNDCTVFNSDIRGFTRMSEGAAPEAMIDMLNEYFEMMVETIFKYEGTLDKFMGDGIMALWGAPAAHQDDPIRTVQSSLEQMERLGTFNRQRIERNQAPLAIGIGIHTGPLVAGYVGSSKALSYTVIGDTANTSARLCGIALAGQIIVSESTLAKLGNRFEVEELPPANLKGKEKPLRIYNVKREKPTATVR